MERAREQLIYPDYEPIPIKNHNREQMIEHIFANVPPEASYQDRALIGAAFSLAEEAHRYQRRANGTPYIDHPLRVTLRLSARYGITDKDMTIGGLLHDVVEDNPQTVVKNMSLTESKYEKDIALAGIENVFGERPARIVAAMTNPPFDSPIKIERQAAYRQHVEQIIEDPEVFILKMSDFTDNAIGLHHTQDAELVGNLARRYDPLFEVYASRLDKGDIPLEKKVINRMYEQLENGYKRNQRFLNVY